jgi:hypothetical protein
LLILLILSEIGLEKLVLNVTSVKGEQLWIY